MHKQAERREQPQKGHPKANTILVNAFRQLDSSIIEMSKHVPALRFVADVLDEELKRLWKLSYKLQHELGLKEPTRSSK